MKDHVRNDDEKFLLQALKFYRSIDRYSIKLGLDDSEVTAFKSDVDLFLHIAKRYRSFTTSFILYNIGNLRRQLLHLCEACINSRNFTADIGEELGIERHINLPVRTRSFFNWRWDLGLSYNRV